MIYGETLGVREKFKEFESFYFRLRTNSDGRWLKKIAIPFAENYQFEKNHMLVWLNTLSSQASFKYICLCDEARKPCGAMVRGTRCVPSHFESAVRCLRRFPFLHLSPGSFIQKYEALWIYTIIQLNICETVMEVINACLFVGMV